MTPPAWVHKRDGRLVPFEPDKISRSLFAATETLGAICCVRPAVRSQLYSRLFQPLVVEGSIVSGETDFPKKGLPAPQESLAGLYPGVSA